MIKIMLKGIPGIWDPTDKFEFTGKWKCGNKYDYRDTDVEFEVKINVNWWRRYWKEIPETYWADSDKFIEVNECDKPTK